MFRHLYFCGIALLIVAADSVAAASPFSLGAQPTYLELNNTIVAKVNGKPITMLDVVKKMDLFFNKQFPHYSDIVGARYEFYQMSWKRFLQDIIDKELIIADAEDAKVEVTPGEVRQEMDGLFGPAVTAKVGELGLTYDGAFEMVKGDLLLRRMVYIRVQMKAVQEVTPQQVRRAYESYARDHRYPEEWSYRVLSVRSGTKEESLAAAERLHSQLVAGTLTFDDVDAAVKEEEGSGVTVQLSEEFTLPPKEISELYKKTLETLTPGTFSEPVLQRSRATKQVLYRIFYLKGVKSEGSDPLDAVEGKLRGELLEASIDKETASYLERLRSQYSVELYYDGGDEGAKLSDYQPFVLR